MGTPDFAVPCLQKLVDLKHCVVGVVTQPDRPKGRGKLLTPPPVKVAARQLGLPVYQPEKVRDEGFVATLRTLDPDLIVVVAFGQLLPESILQLPPLGCINVHASLLPKYRGGAPIHWAIISGERETGITTMFMDKGLDTGDMILKEAIPIPPEATLGEIHDRLALLGAEVLEKTLSFLAKGTAPRTPQLHDRATYAPSLKKEDCRIAWEKPAEQVHNLVRGTNPWPGAYSYFRGKMVKIWKVVPVAQGGVPGEVLAADPSAGLIVACGQGSVRVLSIQPEGRKPMGGIDFINGMHVSAGDMFKSWP